MIYTHAALRRELRLFQISCTTNCTTEIIHSVLTAEHSSVVHRPWQGSTLRCTSRAPATLHHSYTKQRCGSEIILAICINMWNMAHSKSRHTLWYNVRPALNDLHRWHTGKIKWIQLMKQCVEHLLWKLPTQYDTCCNTGQAHFNNTLELSSPQPSSLWENRRKQGVQK